jgi:hypothetical protein
MNERWWSPWREAFFLAMDLFAHLFVALVLIGAIEVAQLALHTAGDPKLLDFVPIRYIFDLMDFALVVLFFIFGTVSMYRAFRGKKD